MTVFKVIGRMSVGDNTAIVVDGKGNLFHNGVGILDENGKPYEVLSVGMDSGINVEEMLNKTSLLIEGNFVSSKLFIQKVLSICRSL